MGYSRASGPAPALTGDALTSAMVGIGMLFAAPATAEPNIEDTLIGASREGMERDDLRVLAVLVTWFGVHAPWVNADRLTRLASAEASPRVRALWSALGHWRAKDRRLARLGALHEGPPLDLLAVGTGFQIRRHGEDPRFAGSALRVPAGVLRDRDRDVLTPAELCAGHRAYRWRVIMGPGYRADMWAALEADGDLSASELARRCHGSFATAWHVRHDFALVQAGGAAAGAAEPAMPGAGPQARRRKRERARG